MTTMISDRPTKTTMGVGFDANRSRSAANQEAWRRAIGTKPVAARLELLPEGKPRWNRIGVSAIVQVVLIGFVLLVPLLYPEKNQNCFAHGHRAVGAARHRNSGRAAATAAQKDSAHSSSAEARSGRAR